MKQILLTASANTGMGLWTMICVAFSTIFGVESRNLRKKHTKVLKRATDRLIQQCKGYGENIEISDFRTVWNTSLSCTVSAVVTIVSKKCPKCGAQIDDEMVFCGSCGEKVK